MGFGISKKYRHLWLPELLVVLGLMVLTGLVFSLTNWDLDVARWFFHPNHPLKPWPEEDLAIWKFFYRMAPVISIILSLGSLGVLVLGALHKKWSRFRGYAVFVFLSVLLGPGLVVNATFKDHWGRPRPRQVQEFGGKYEYREFYERGISGKGKSFPCGHSSIGFVGLAFWLLLKRRRKRLAQIALVSSLTLGTFMGIGRMAAGGHFLSDVLFSAYFPFLVSWFLYYFALKIPEREDSSLSEKEFRRKPWAVLGYSFLAILMVVGALFANPVYKDFQHVIDRKSWDGGGGRLLIEVDKGDVYLMPIKDSENLLEIRGQVRGFGFPGHKVMPKWSEERAKSVTFSLKRKGLFTEYDGQIKVFLDRARFDSVTVLVEAGEVKVDKSLRGLLSK